MKEFEISTVLLIAGFGLLCVVLALICIWVRVLARSLHVIFQQKPEKIPVHSLRPLHINP